MRAHVIIILPCGPSSGPPLPGQKTFPRIINRSVLPAATFCALMTYAFFRPRNVRHVVASQLRRATEKSDRVPRRRWGRRNDRVFLHPDTGRASGSLPETLLFFSGLWRTDVIRWVVGNRGAISGAYQLRPEDVCEKRSNTNCGPGLMLFELRPELYLPCPSSSLFDNSILTRKRSQQS